MKDNAQEQLDEAQLAYLQMLRNAGCEFLFRTEIPRPYSGLGKPKPYVWMKDRHGQIFLERIPEDDA